MLHRKAVRFEIYQILYILDPGIYICACKRNPQPSSGLDTTRLAEIVFPDEMIRHILSHQQRASSFEKLKYPLILTVSSLSLNSVERLAFTLTSPAAVLKRCRSL